MPDPTQSSTSALSVPPTTNITNNSPSAQLGKDDFLKLLVTQLQHQDPTSPTDSSQFMGQLAQFSSLEQMTNMSQSLDGIATTSAVTQGVGFIGRNIGFLRTDGSSGSGIAQSIAVVNGAVVLDVGGEKVTPSQITSVGIPPAVTTSPST